MAAGDLGFRTVATAMQLYHDVRRDNPVSSHHLERPREQPCHDTGSGSTEDTMKMAVTGLDPQRRASKRRPRDPDKRERVLEMAPSRRAEGPASMFGLKHGRVIKCSNGRLKSAVGSL
ncbi:hypothetical protein AAFF_G00049720 [Aldrovandia affinis]|uniref:Uncharacterized protein n=1 Tax=Aldrovandia affinis TaxID=143900 RepID=A0AAD7WEL5_9TELE|nr:hypothetical protein AAFF_G00049720 [Aldrovandia affinis]